MVTLHPTAKAFADGFVPMITLRGDKGCMIGSRCPQGAYREFRTFTDKTACEIEARLIAFRIALQFPDVLKVSAK